MAKKIDIENVLSVADTIRSFITSAGETLKVGLALKLGAGLGVDIPDPEDGEPAYPRLYLDEIGPSQHGNQPGGLLHAEAIPGEEAGFLSAAFATLLSQATNAATNATLAIRGASAQLVAAWFQTGTGTKAQSGTVRCAKDETLGAWRNDAGSADITAMRCDNVATDRIICFENAAGVDFKVGTNGDYHFYSNDINFARLQHAGGTIPTLHFAGAGHARISNSADYRIEVRVGTNDIIKCSSSGVAFNGKSPLAPADFGIEFSLDTSSTLYEMFASDVFAGIDNAQPGDVYAQLTDVNLLRQDVYNIFCALHYVMTHLKNTGLFKDP